MRRFLLTLLIMIMIPYVSTLAWTGQLEGVRKRGEKVTIVERENKNIPIAVEEYLVHVLAAQIPAVFEPETLKAQAILARTYIYGLMEHRAEIYEEELDMDALSYEQMKALWGETDFASMFSKLQTAVRETEGLYILYDGSIIEPLFCYASAGKTRSFGESFPYLEQVESPGDLYAENYRSLPVFETKEFVQKINEIPGAVAVSEMELDSGGGIQIVERD
jgi:stage II sporulation protein D